MRIDRTFINECRLEMLSPGELFTRDNVVYIRTDKWENTTDILCVNLEDGECIGFHRLAIVQISYGILKVN